MVGILAIGGGLAFFGYGCYWWVHDLRIARAARRKAREEGTRRHTVGGTDDRD